MSKCLGVILAGGRGRRMGRDKALLAFDEVSFVENAVARLAPQVDKLVISRQQDQVALSKTLREYDVVYDLWPDWGPAGALYSVLAYAKRHRFHALITVPVDVPNFPDKLVESLSQTDRLTLAATSSPEPAFAYIPASAFEEILQRIEGGERKLLTLYTPHHLFHFNDAAAFFNVNTPQDLKKLNGS